MSRATVYRLFAAVAGLLWVTSVEAYVDLAPTLARVVRESQSITVVEVDRFVRDKNVVILKKVRELKGTTGEGAIKHELIRQGESVVDRTILEWAEPGRRAVIFGNARAAVVCLGETWYQVSAAEEGWWRLGPARPDLPMAYYGSVTRLADAVPLILDGKVAIITALPHGADDLGGSYELALNRASLPGIVRVERLRASARMPDMALGVGKNPDFVVGVGRAGLDDVAGLREKLTAADAATRAESAADLGFLGPSAADAIDDLVKLLDDDSVLVWLSAGAAILRIKPSSKRALEVLAKGLDSKEAVTRRHAARAAGLAGDAAAPLAGRLGELLGDKDMLVSRLALQAIATLGPAASASLEPVTALLDDSEHAIDAADALARMGAAARPALEKLAKMLSADAATVRWAGVRAMSQIGGDEAAPAVRYMIRELPTASEIDGYNMLIYLSLLGPVAKDAIPAVRNARIRNPFLRQVVLWTIVPSSDIPPGGDITTFIIEGYFQEMGEHIKPTVQALLKRILAGTAGELPAWGYKLLARYPDDSLSALVPALTHKERALRERAALTLAFIGRAAVHAKPDLEKAIKAAEDEREERLLKWCLRAIGS